MKREILISATQREIRVAILEDEQLVELQVDRPENKRMVGDIYLGKVEAVLPGIQAAFVNIGTENVRLGVPNFSAYCAAKGAQAAWSASMARELAPWNITVNTVCPGWIPVERHENDPQSAKDAYLAGIPMQRWGIPADVGGIVAFLASEAASFVTGQDIAVNGGNTVN